MELTFKQVNTAEYVAELRKEVSALIRLLEDAALVESHSSVMLLIGKLARTQSLIDEMENITEWRNEQ
ncbi:hypothetical protein [Peribacillus muralis]|uniref:hypothetical protein n=1 Tax=Peribacillus muralis TaxID=264697 RepID=UPI00366B0B61